MLDSYHEVRDPVDLHLHHRLLAIRHRFCLTCHRQHLHFHPNHRQHFRWMLADLHQNRENP